MNTINIGTSPNDGTGDPIRDAFTKVNDNFSELISGFTPSYKTLTWGSTTSWSCDSNSTSQNAELTLTGHTTLSISSSLNGMNGNLIVIQDSVGGYSITLPSPSKVANNGAGAVTIASAAQSVSILSWIKRGGIFYWTYGVNFT